MSKRANRRCGTCCPQCNVCVWEVGKIRLEIILEGQPVTKKNSQRIVNVGGYPKPLPSKQFERYQADCLWQIRSKHRLNIDTPVNIECVYYMQTRRAVDLTNLLEATDDILVTAGVIADDNCRIVAAHDGSRVAYDKQNPRVEICITPYQGETLSTSTTRGLRYR